VSDLPPGFVLEPAGSPPPTMPGMFANKGRRPSVAPVPIAPGTIPHDGDTLPVGGVNGRVFGADAFELGQPGIIDGRSVDLGAQGQAFFRSRLGSGGTATPTGAVTYSRPVVTLDVGGQDYGRSLLDQGLGVAAPQYLRSDPTRFVPYMEAERGARLNRRGAFAGQFQMPDAFRKREPWAAPVASTDGKGEAFFGDEPTPFQGLRPEIAKGYLDLSTDPKSTADDLMAYAANNGFQISRKEADSYIKQRNAGAKVNPTIGYRAIPRVLTDAGDGATGAAMRGVGDPVNMLDEMGAVVDTLGGTPGRESLWNSDRRFGDILYNNMGQNRSILEFDDDRHPYARFGGQFASGLVAPGASVEGLGFNVAKQALRSGASRYAAEAAARSAVRSRLLATGSIEGGIAGFGAGEGGVGERIPSAIAGGAIGAAGGLGLGLASPYLNRGFGKVRGLLASRFRRMPGDVDTGMTDLTTEAARTEVGNVSPAAPRAAAAAMDMAHDLPEGFVLEGPAPREIDRIDIGRSDLPPGFQFEDPLGAVRPIGQRLSPNEIATTARTVQPGDVMPIPRNEVETLAEAERINAGMRPAIPAPNERDVLAPYTLPGQTRARRNPLDLNAWLRTQGGVKDQGGDLASMGVNNRPRDLDLAGDVGLPRLVNPDGMPLDDAALKAWEAGYFPHHSERPSISEFLDAVGETYRGGAGRVFHPDDYGTVDSYYATIAERNAIEQAEQAGTPVHKDLGRPIGLEDLDANQPPATAYEDLPSVGGKAGNIALDGLSSPQDIRRALINVDAKVGGFDAARRGQMAHGETAALAREMGMTADDLLKRRQGQALNAEQALAARQILAKSADELVKLARKAQGGSDADLAAFRQAWVRHVAIQEQVSGATAEAGRALSSFRMTADSRDATAGRIHKALIESAGGRDNLEDAAQAILDIADGTGGPAKINRIARDALKPKMADKLSELYINSLLSGPQTHAANFLSNSLTAALQIPEHATAALLGVLRPGSSDRVLASELPARTFGMLQGTRDGLRAFAETMRTGNIADHAAKVEGAEMRAISGLKGSIIRTPTRALSASDELFKGIARRMEINGLALRQAKSEGLKGAALKARLADLTSNPTDEMLEQAKDYARYLTFQRPLGEFGQAVTRISGAKAFGLPYGKLIIPFVRTPANLLKYSAERSPAAPLLKEWRADMMAGGARRDLAISKALLGSGLGMLIATYASEGRISGGGPADTNATALMRADGWQPYSIRIGDRWYSYSRFDPISTTIGTAADLATKGDAMTDAQREEKAGIIAAAIIRNLGNKTWLSGVSDLVNLLDDPMRNAGDHLRNQAATIAIPTLLAQIARASDPYYRETDTLGDAMKARIPMLSQTAPARLDLWGQPAPRGQFPYGLSTIAPVAVSNVKNDPVNASLLAAGAHISKPNATVGGVKLTPEQYRSYQQMSGQLGYGAMGNLVASPEWMTLPDDMRQDEVSRGMRKARADARARLGLDFKRQKAAPASDLPPGFMPVEDLPPGFQLEQANDLPPGFVLKPVDDLTEARRKTGER